MGSRIANKPIPIPSGVEVKLNGHEVRVKGKAGDLRYQLHPNLSLNLEDGFARVAVNDEHQNSSALAGTARATLNNMVHGVSKGFQCELVLVGVGYRAKTQGKVLSLNVGHSHPVELTMPEGITVEAPSATEITVKGADKHAVYQVAANIRAVRPVESYKGKGIRYKNETVILKEVKKK